MLCLVSVIASAVTHWLSWQILTWFFHCLAKVAAVKHAKKAAPKRAPKKAAKKAAPKKAHKKAAKKAGAKKVAKKWFPPLLWIMIDLVS